MSELRDPDDSTLGRLLEEGLGRAAGGPVDDGDLLAGARRGAARIRRRRRTVMSVATVMVLAGPVGFAASELMRPAGETTSTASVAAAPELASASPGAAREVASATVGGQAGDADGSSEPFADPSAAAAASGAVPAPSVLPNSASVAAESKSATDSRVAGGVASVPDDALLTAADLAAAGLPRPAARPTSDTSYSGPVPAAPPAETCGAALVGVPAAAFGRVAVLDGGTAEGWLLGSTVRVFAGTGAQDYAAVASRSGCLAPVTVAGADSAAVGAGPRDSQGRTHWYGVARVGRVVTEIRLLTPRGSGTDRADVVRLLTASVGRVTSSGLVAAAAGDPALG